VLCQRQHRTNLVPSQPAPLEKLAVTLQRSRCSAWSDVKPTLSTGLIRCSLTRFQNRKTATKLVRRFRTNSVSTPNIPSWSNMRVLGPMTRRINHHTNPMGTLASTRKHLYTTSVPHGLVCPLQASTGLIWCLQRTTISFFSSSF
jgi:hypothetical protein